MSGPTLVTGAAGFAGGHLLALLRHDGPVEGWYRPGAPPPAAALGVDNVTWREVDLRDADAVDAAIRELAPSAVYHLAGAANQGAAWANTDVALDLNARVTHVLLQAIKRHAPDARVLVTTSAAIYAASDSALDEHARVAPATPYGVSKLAQELVARAAAGDDGLDVVIVRPFNHIGPGQGPGFFAPEFARQLALIESGRSTGPMRVGNLSPRRDFSDVRDVVRAYRLLVRHGARGEIYNVCRCEAVEIGALLNLMRAEVSVPVDVVVDPAKLRPIDVPLLLGDHRRLTTTTGWTPQIPMAETLHDILEEQRAAIRD